MRQFIAKKAGFPLQDFLKKTNIFDTLQILKESQFWSDERIFDYQSIKLRSLVEYAYKNVPYYETLFKKIKLMPSDIQSVNDIEKIPILTKDIMRRENMNLISRSFNMRTVKRGKTGGTTGAPTIILKDTRNRSFTWASYYRWYEWMGLNYYDCTASFWGARTVLAKPITKRYLDKTLHYLQNEIKINSFSMNKNEMHRIYKQIQNSRPMLIKGYLSSLIDFGEFLVSNGYNDINPIALSSTSETLLPHHRLFLQKAYNAPVYDQYGCGELSAISYECSAHNGLHVNMEHMVCEILDENAVPILDKVGRVVGTDLDNYVMPFIRFENGDLTSISSKKCSCGVNQPLMSSIDGRSIDTIVLNNGSSVHGVFFTKILSEAGILSDKVQKFQVYQEKTGEIELRVQCEFPLDDKLRLQLLNALKKFFDNVIYSEHKFLPPESNGKFKYIINAIKK